MAYKTIYPFTNEVLKEYENTSDAQLEEVLETAHQLYKKWRKDDQLETRKAQLHEVAVILRRDRDKYAEILTKDMGKLFTEAQGEIELCADIADYYADNADKFLEPTTLDTDTGEAYYIKQATGVILAVEPWNFPYYQIMRVFAPNFIVGNPMVLKHASICPWSAQSFEELVIEAGAEKGTFTNLFVSYGQVSQIIADKRVVGVCLTGSERGGASIAEEAGKNLKKTTLELGGDDAFIILDDADWDELESVLFFSRLYNAGQVCTSSKRFIVLEKDYDRFKELLTKVFKTAKWGDPMDPETTLAPLSSAQAKEDVLAQIKLAVDNGAELVYGGEAIDHPGNFVMPTIIAGLTKDNPIYYQEIFGPVGEIYKVSSEEEAIEVANDSNYGLGGTIFSSNKEHREAVAAKIETGMSFINSGWASLPELPFGGIKNSGYGRELSELGFTAFVNEHLIYTPKK
ncbi:MULTISPECIES: NAD-dependent succinate-semialdehyde dehydrogenase [Streptococcus]|uniref:NAD-dependent succinate-semialdehyde dehydrogenase n=2 Tax=Streptococcus parauberis TaxID=1348 RepID=A0AAE4HX96_9STRE|nr:NAD-dependent succinate-semialdehyde dehydrogenase [Streptococcus parauberis]EGE53555.1 putative succinate-semialdehyde dehydrogenase (NAD(P)(+)) [Streptococcus parauberis NCFD 2020]EMF50015.1 Succinate-semialdehyde dehydrogenase [NAD] [Streptococcus parauberis KRS-02109]MDT2732452.1 NAD-dependent succinate-semialdehyde dehydrogenase [Streptococcus parauberis]ONH63515.1 Succinate-semialdehyde dehydrogenase [NADP(+)] 1 [Streptococcus parauberis]PCH11848.1 Succinate-semialdehyde dehydrogenase